MDATIAGFALLLLGAVCGGSFGLPSKFVPKSTPWETLWGPFFFFVTILIPVTLFPLLTNGLFATFGQANLDILIWPLVFGFLWGLGSMTLGMSFSFIGLSLAYALNYGAQIAVGSMGPMLIHTPKDLNTPYGSVIIAGVAICIAGVVVCGRAGVLRTRSQEDVTGKQADDGPQPRANSGTILKGMIIAFLSGILCACYSIAVSFSAGVTKITTSEPLNNSELGAAFVVTALILWGGSFSACGYSVLKLSKNKTWISLTLPGIGRVLMIAFTMACLHNGAILCFFYGASKLGDLGIGIGYAVFMSFAIIVGNVNGFLTKEWKDASKKSIVWIAIGVIILILGVCVLGKGQRMQATTQETASVSEFRSTPAKRSSQDAKTTTCLHEDSQESVS